MNIKMLEPIHFAILSGMNRLGRRNFFKKNHKKFDLKNWALFNSLPGIYKNKLIINEEKRLKKMNNLL